jgi:hypothetical protein
MSDVRCQMFTIKKATDYTVAFFYASVAADFF